MQKLKTTATALTFEDGCSKHFEYGQLCFNKNKTTENLFVSGGLIKVD